jgi:hypothetical protein
VRRLLFDAPRRAGSVRQSKQQAAGARHWHTQGRGTPRPPYKRRRQTAVHRLCAQSAITGSTRNTHSARISADRGKPAGARQRRAWFGQREGNAARSGRQRPPQQGRCNDGQRTPWQRGVGAISPRCCSKAVSGVHRADRGPLASRHRQRPGTSSSGGWIAATGFRRKRAVVPEIEHVGDDAAGSSVTVARIAWEEQGGEQGP